jgi:restriction endonuclease S subunit
MADKKTSDEYTCDGENIFISNVAPIGKIYYYNGKCDFASILNKLELKNMNSNVRYFYYYLLFNNSKIIEQCEKGAANKSLDITFFNEMQIPVPPIEVQNLIVKELDSMYKQKESLQNANNEMNNYRKVQFEMLLSKCKDVKNEKFGNICEYRKKNQKLKASDGLDKGKYRFYASSAKKLYLDNYEFEEKSLIISRGGDAFINVAEKFSISHDDIYVLSTNEKYEYVQLYILSKIDEFRDGYKGTTIKHINQDFLNNFKIVLPSLKDQESIVQQMEKYDELVKLQQAQIEEIDTTIKARFEFHLEKCKETKPTEVKEDETEIQEDELSNDSTTKKIAIKSKQVTNNKSVIKKDDFDEELEELEKEFLKTKRSKDNIKIEEVTNKSSKTVKSTVQKNNKSEIEQEELDEIVLVGKVECINEGGNYYKFVNGKKGELYAKTSNGKVSLYKKPTTQKV